MRLDFSDILEIGQMDQIRTELDSLTSEFQQTERQDEKQLLAFKMRRLIDQLERHDNAIKRSMLVPMNL